MTSEVIIMNRNAMALAADSAVTMGNIKTYNGVNKLFYISNNPPIGIMIFGSADFENIPMETLIKEFKRSISNILQDYSDQEEQKSHKEEKEVQSL
jgi:ATP-dependent protease HslVU (ClpYQ) peptidase subunit